MDVEIEGAVVEEHLRRNRTPNRGKHQQPRSESAVHIGSVRDVAVEFVAGCVSGCAGIIVGQPFDTVKVRLQTQNVAPGSGAQAGEAAVAAAAAAAAKLSATTTANATAATGSAPRTSILELKHGQPRRYQGALACAVEAVSREGVSALFKGMGTPLASAALVNAICFGAYAQSQRIFCASGLMVRETMAAGRNQEGETGPGNAGFFWSFMAGCVAGLSQTTVIIPTENIKVKLQVQVGGPGSSKLRYQGPLDCAMKLIKEQGLGSLYRGTSATLIRDTPSMGLYFASYEGIKGWMKTQWGFSEGASSCWAGGLAGALSWAVIYPFDVVKSIQQAATDPLDPSSRSLSACLRSVYDSAGGGIPGVRRFYRGLGTTLLRAVPVNAAIFPTYEWTVRMLNEAFPPSE